MSAARAVNVKVGATRNAGTITAGEAMAMRMAAPQYLIISLIINNFDLAVFGQPFFCPFYRMY